MSEIEVVHTLLPAFDERDHPKANYGKGSITYYIALVGEEGAISWDLCTRIDLDGVSPTGPTAGPITWHSPNEDDGTLSTDDCRFIDGTCYGDSHFIGGKRVLERLREEGSRGMYRRLLNTYNDIFNTSHSVDDLAVPGWVYTDDPRGFKRMRQEADPGTIGV